MRNALMGLAAALVVGCGGAETCPAELVYFPSPGCGTSTPQTACGARGASWVPACSCNGVVISAGQEPYAYEYCHGGAPCAAAPASGTLCDPTTGPPAQSQAETIR